MNWITGNGGLGTVGIAGFRISSNFKKIVVACVKLVYCTKSEM